MAASGIADESDASDQSVPHRSLIASIAAGAARRWQATFAAMIVVLIAGVSAFGFGLDREGFPPINTPISVVSGTYFVDNAKVVDQEVVVPLVAAFSAVEGVVSTESVALPSSYSVVVEFESDVSSDAGTERLVALNLDVPGVLFWYPRGPLSHSWELFGGGVEFRFVCGKKCTPLW